MILRPPRSTRTDTLSLHDALPIYAMILSLTTDGAQGYAFSPPDTKESKTEARQQPAAKPSWAALASQSPSAKPDRGNAFLGNLSSYAPIYAVYGPGTCRSEENTSELQSIMRLSYAVFYLKKKNTTKA